MTLQGNFTNLHRILRAPASAEGSGAASPAADDGMGGALELLNKRGAGIELEEPSPAEKAAAEAKAKKETKIEEWSDSEAGVADGEEEPTAEEIAGAKKISDAAEQARKDKADADKRAKAAADGSDAGLAKELPSAEEIATETAAWKEKIAEIEKKIEDADPDDKAGLAKELTEAQDNLAQWEAAAEPGPDVETVETVKAELTKAQAEKGQLEARVRELEAKGEPGLSVENVHPLFLADKPEQIENLDAQYAQFERWAMEHFDGCEEETDAKGKVTQPAYTKEQVRARYAEISQLRKDLIPQARQAMQLRQQGEAAARKEYPELFDPKRPESKAVQNILQAAPVLRVIFPGASIYAIMRDALEGERLRNAREAAKASAAGRAKGNGAGGGGTRRPLPRVARPGAGGVGTGAAAGLKRSEKKALVKANGGIDPEKFMEAGGDRKALIASIS